MALPCVSLLVWDHSLRLLHDLIENRLHMLIVPKINTKLIPGSAPPNSFPVNQYKAIKSIAVFICKEKVEPQLPSLSYLKKLSVRVFGDARRAEDLDNSISGYFMIPPRSKPKPGKTRSQDPTNLRRQILSEVN